MKKRGIHIVAMLIAVIPMQAQYIITKTVAGNGGLGTQNSQYKLNGTLGQTGTGVGESTLFIAKTGFWYELNTMATGVEKKPENMDDGYVLYQNYPNPFLHSTTIKYSLPETGKSGYLFVRLAIYDVLGREVKVLVNGLREPGTYYERWERSNNRAGLYFYKIEVASFPDKLAVLYIRSKKMTILPQK